MILIASKKARCAFTPSRLLFAQGIITLSAAAGGNHELQFRMFYGIQYMTRGTTASIALG